MNQKGGIALILLIIFLAISLAVGAYFITKNTGFLPQAFTTKSTQNNQPSSSSSESSVNLQTEYKNPFDESSNYQNPFESYQNPFESL